MKQNVLSYYCICLPQLPRLPQMEYFVFCQCRQMEVFLIIALTVHIRRAGCSESLLPPFQFYWETLEQLLLVTVQEFLKVQCEWLSFACDGRAIQTHQHTSINVAHYLRDSTQYYKSGIRFPVWTQGLGQRQYLWSFLQGWWWEKLKKKEKVLFLYFCPLPFFYTFQIQFQIY